MHALVNRPPSPADLSGLPGSWYIRLSLDEGDLKQDATSQRQNIQGWLAGWKLDVREGFRFEDAEGYTPRHRPQDRPKYQQLLEAVRAGLVKWVVVDHQYRIGGKDEWHYASMIHEFRQAGCHVWTVGNDLLTGDDGLAFFKGGFGAKSSQHEQQSKAWHVIRGKKTKAKAGCYHGGYVPYGLDVVCYRDGEERWRCRWFGHFLRKKIYPGGQAEDYNGKGNLPVAEGSDILRLAPGPDDRLEVVRYIFKTYAEQSISTYQIAKALNERRVKPTYGGIWLGSAVDSVLGNTAYIGLPAWNKYGQGEFLEFDGQDTKPVKTIRGRRERDKAAWVYPDKPVFDPVIPLEHWEAVQRKLEAPVKRRSPKTAEIWLAGLVHCAGCGVRMRGQKRNNYCQFLCQTGDRRRMGVSGVACRRNTVHHELVESVVGQWLADAGKTLETLAAAHEAGDLGLLATLQADYDRGITAYLAAARRMVEYAVKHGDDDTMQEVGGLVDAFNPVEGEAVRPEEEGGLVRLYRQAYQASGSEVQARHEGLEAEHTRIMGVIERFQGTPRAVVKKQAELAAVEAELTALEEQLADQSSVAEGLARRLAEIQGTIQTAGRRSSSEATLRHKADALGRLVKRIDVHFEPTGKKYPQSVPVFVEVIPHEGEEVRYPVSCSPDKAPPARRF